MSNPNSYTAQQAMDDLWKLDRELTGIHQQPGRDAWTRIHNFLHAIIEQQSGPSREQIIKECADRAAFFFDCYHYEDAGAESMKQWILDMLRDATDGGHS